MFTPNHGGNDSIWLIDIFQLGWFNQPPTTGSLGKLFRKTSKESLDSPRNAPPRDRWIPKPLRWRLRFLALTAGKDCWQGVVGNHHTKFLQHMFRTWNAWWFGRCWCHLFEFWNDPFLFGGHVKQLMKFKMILLRWLSFFKMEGFFEVSKMRNSFFQAKTDRWNRSYNFLERPGYRRVLKGRGVKLGNCKDS